jgi:hypothetical protein
MPAQRNRHIFQNISLLKRKNLSVCFLALSSFILLPAPVWSQESVSRKYFSYTDQYIKCQYFILSSFSQNSLSILFVICRVRSWPICSSCNVVLVSGWPIVSFLHPSTQAEGHFEPETTLWQVYINEGPGSLAGLWLPVSGKCLRLSDLG